MFSFSFIFQLIILASATVITLFIILRIYLYLMVKKKSEDDTNTIPTIVKDDLNFIREELSLEGGKEEMKWYWYFFGKPDARNINWFFGFFPVDHKRILGDHEKVSRLVFRRLLLRYKQLDILTILIKKQK